MDKPLRGSVYAVQQAGLAIPGLVADLRGRVNAKIRIATAIIAGKYIRSTVTDVPDLPMSSFTMSLDGGDKRPLESKFDLCFRSADSSRFRTMKADVTFNAHSGARTTSKPRLGVEGCAPSATATLRRAATRKATLSLTVARHPDADDIKSLSVLLPRGARLVPKRGRGKNVKVQAAGANAARVRAAGTRKLTIAKLSKGSRRVKVTLRRGTVKLSSKLRRHVAFGKALDGLRRQVRKGR